MTGTVVSCQDGLGLMPTTIRNITVCLIGMLRIVCNIVLLLIVFDVCDLIYYFYFINIMF